MKNNHNRGPTRPAREKANDLLSYTMGIMAVVLSVGPIFNWARPGFISHVGTYYGDGFAGFASIFLFFLLALVIFSAATLLMHIAATVFEGRTKGRGLFGRFHL